MKKKDVTKQFYTKTERFGADHKTPNTIRSARTLSKAIYFRRAHLDFIRLQKSLPVYLIRQVRQMTFALAVGSITHGTLRVGRFGSDPDHKELSLIPICVFPDEQISLARGEHMH